MFTKGNKLSVGNKGGGRKTIAQEVAEAREMITQEALIALANSKVKKQLDKIDNFKDVKEMALPITLRGIVERKELSGKVQVEQITGVRIVKDGTGIQNKD